MKLKSALVVFLLCLAAANAHAQQLTAVTAAGKTISYRQGVKPSPWDHDVLKKVGPVYSESQRERHNQGTGLYRGTIDVETGQVIRMAIEKSTGYQPLDEAAVTALKQWRFKPRTWREFEIFVSFVSFGDQQLYRDYLRRMWDNGVEQIPVRRGR